MREVDEHDADRYPAQLGDFFWRFDGTKRVLVVAIPMNNDLRPLFCEWTIDHENHCNASWKWTGTEEKPTLEPSLHAVGIWHGFVRKGMLVEA